MARITVEDCVKIIPNRFELCLIASNRAKSILSGASTSLDAREKPAVISLREIADNLIDIEAVKQNIVSTIKNRGVVNTSQLASEDVVEAIESEGEGGSVADVRNEMFTEENAEVED